MTNKNQPKIWSLIFSRQSEPLYRKLRTTTIYLLIYSIIVVVAQLFYDDIFEELQVQNIGQFHLIFSFVISILVAFRVNASYSRWWEGRGHWGNLVNNSRNLALKFNNYIGLNNEPKFLDYLSMFPTVFKFHIRKQYTQCNKIINTLGINITDDAHIPSAVINQMYKIINNYRIEGKISLEQYLSMDTHLANIIDLVGGCEKIVNTPLPAPFKMFIRQALLFYMIIFPFGWVEKFGFLIIPMIIVIVDVLLGLELISEDIENPFSGIDYQGSVIYDTTIDLETIALNIASNVKGIAKQS